MQASVAEKGICSLRSPEVLTCVQAGSSKRSGRTRQGWGGTHTRKFHCFCASNTRVLRCVLLRLRNTPAKVSSPVSTRCISHNESKHHSSSAPGAPSPIQPASHPAPRSHDTPRFVSSPTHRPRPLPSGICYPDGVCIHPPQLSPSSFPHPTSRRQLLCGIRRRASDAPPTAWPSPTF